MKIFSTTVTIALILATTTACGRHADENAATSNATTQAADLLNAADGDMNVVQASGGDIAKARLLAQGKRMAAQAAPTPTPEAAEPTKPENAKPKTACWTPPSGPNVIDDPDHIVTQDEIGEIESATGRPYREGDTIWGKAEDRCPH